MNPKNSGEQSDCVTHRNRGENFTEPHTTKGSFQHEQHRRTVFDKHDIDLAPECMRVNSELATTAIRREDNRGGRGRGNEKRGTRGERIRRKARRQS